MSHHYIFQNIISDPNTGYLQAGINISFQFQDLYFIFECLCEVTLAPLPSDEIVNKGSQPTSAFPWQKIDF